MAFLYGSSDSLPAAPNSFDSDADDNDNTAEGPGRHRARANGEDDGKLALSACISSLADEPHVEALDRLASQAGISSFAAGATDESTGRWAHGPD
jgi:hypothetical protein